jgi:hypothetical protein
MMNFWICPTEYKRALGEMFAAKAGKEKEKVTT